MQRRYLEEGKLDVRVIDGAWFDAGTHEALFETSAYVREHHLIDRFDPILNEAIQAFNLEFKQIVSLRK